MDAGTHLSSLQIKTKAKSDAKYILFFSRANKIKTKLKEKSQTKNHLKG